MKRGRGGAQVSTTRIKGVDSFLCRLRFILYNCLCIHGGEGGPLPLPTTLSLLPLWIVSLPSARPPLSPRSPLPPFESAE